MYGTCHVIEPAHMCRWSSSWDGVLCEVVDGFATGEVGGVGVCLVDDDQQLDDVVSGAHRCHVQGRVASVRPRIHVRRLRAPHQQLHHIRSTVLGGPVQCRVAGDEVAPTGQTCMRMKTYRDDVWLRLLIDSPFYVGPPLDTKYWYVISETFFPANLLASTEKLNLTQQTQNSSGT